MSKITIAAIAALSIVFGAVTVTAVTNPSWLSGAIKWVSSRSLSQQWDDVKRGAEVVAEKAAPESN